MWIIPNCYFKGTAAIDVNTFGGEHLINTTGRELGTQEIEVA
jgi:hypothetical protein